MDYPLVFALCFAAAYVAGAGSQQHVPDALKPEVRPSSGDDAIYPKLARCALSMDVACFLDSADEFVVQKRTSLLAEADMEALTSTKGRSSEHETPSHIANIISKLIAELTDIFKDTMSGLLPSAKQGDNDEDDDIDESADQKQDDEEDQHQNGVGEARKKKKKKEKIKNLIKLIIVGLILKAKLTLLAKLFSAALQIKFFLVALAGLILNAARFYLDLKKGHQPQKVIYYEHAQHQHHYEGGEEDWAGSSPGGGYWGRAYDEEEEQGKPPAQQLAYAKQRPAYSKIDGAPSKSWF